MFESGPKLPLKVRLTLLWQTGMLRAPLMRLLSGVGLLLGGGLVFALLQGDLACCGVGVGGVAALAGVLLLSVGLYEVTAVLLWSD